MVKLNKGNSIFIAGFIILIFVLSSAGLLFNAPASITAQPKNVVYENGKLYTITQIAVTSEVSVNYDMIGGSKTLPNGTTIEPKTKVETFAISAQKPRCIYGLTSESVKLPGTDIVLYEKYRISNDYRRYHIVQVKNVNTGKFVNVDAYDSQTQGVSLADTDGTGFAKIDAIGGWSGSYDCISGSGLVVVKAKDGSPRVFSSYDYDKSLALKLSTCSPYNVPACLSAIDSIRYGEGLQTLDTWSNRYVLSAFSNGNTNLTAIGNSLGTPAVIITADQDYFESVWYSSVTPPEAPEIIGFSNNEGLEGKTTSYVIYIKNPSEFTKSYTTTVTAKYGSVSPYNPVFSNVASGADASTTFKYTAPSTITSDINEEFTIKVCDNQIAQFTGQACATQTYARTVKDSGILPSPVKVCGDNICSSEIGENTYTCPADCGNTPTPTCENKLEVYEGGECVCIPGYIAKYDVDTGVMTCVKPTSDNTLLLIGIAVLIMGVGAYMLMNKRK